MRELYKKTYPDSMDSQGPRSDASFTRGAMTGTSENMEKGNYVLEPSSTGAMIFQCLGYRPDGNEQSAGYTYEMNCDIEGQISYATPLPYGVKYVDILYNCGFLQGAGYVDCDPFITDENGNVVAHGTVLKGTTYRVDMTAFSEATDAYKHTYYVNCYAHGVLNATIVREYPYCNAGIWSIKFKYF